MQTAIHLAIKVGRATVVAVGLGASLALLLGVATVALAAVPGDPLKLGKVNTINAVSTLVGSVSGSMLTVDNNSTALGATALDLRVEPGKTPIRVNSQAKVANLNADRLDGKNQAVFARADTPTYESINAASTGPPPFDPFASNRAFCDDGDRLLTGGYFDLSDNGVAVESFGELDGWRATVKRTDNNNARISIRATCLDFPPLRK